MLEEKGALKCDCGGTFTEQLHDFEGIQSPALVCQNCGYVTLTLNQAEVLMKLKELQTLLPTEVCEKKKAARRHAATTDNPRSGDNFAQNSLTGNF